MKNNFGGIFLKQFITQLRFALGSLYKYTKIDNARYKSILASINKQTDKRT